MTNSPLPLKNDQLPKSLMGVSLAVSAVAMALSIFAMLFRTDQSGPLNIPEQSAWQVASSEKTLKIGVGAFPPYTIIDPSTDNPEERYSGFCIDMVRHIANSFDPPWKIEYHELNWDTLRADLYSGKFDFVPNVMYLTIPRLPEFEFTSSYAFMPMGIGVVRADETRFTTFDSLNDPSVNISLVQGWTPTELAKARLPRASLLIRPMDNPAAIQYQELTSGRADVILQDAATALLIKQSHPNDVKVLWLDRPPIRFACSFMLRKGDTEYRDFLSQSIEAMLVDGTISEFDKTWNGLVDIPILNSRSGSGVLRALEGK